MSDEDFWRHRCTEHGHTGWADPVIYAWDQLERLSIIERTLSRFQPPSRRALDFGCGTGDFSRLLVRLGYRVEAYDPFVTVRYAHPFFAQIRALDQITSRIGLFLSVTVLDHILDEREVAAVLRKLHTLAARGSSLLALEYAFDESAYLPPNTDYQALRSLETWRCLFEEQGWSLDWIEDVPHPTSSPSDGWTRYSRSRRTRLLRRIAPALPARASKLAYQTNARIQHGIHGNKGIHDQASPIKLMSYTAKV